MVLGDEVKLTINGGRAELPAVTFEQLDWVRIFVGHKASFLSYARSPFAAGSGHFLLAENKRHTIRGAPRNRPSY